MPEKRNLIESPQMSSLQAMPAMCGIFRAPARQPCVANFQADYSPDPVCPAGSGRQGDTDNRLRARCTTAPPSQLTSGLRTTGLTSPPHATARRQLLQSAAATTAGLLLPFTLPNCAAAVPPTPTPRPLQIVDTNVSLFHWPFRPLPLDDTAKLLAALRSLGITRALAGSFEGLFQRDLTGVNRRLAEACAGCDQLLPIGSVNPSKPGWQADFELCREELRMVGIRLHPGVHGYTLEHAKFRSLLERAAESGMFVQVVAVVEDRRTQPDLFRSAEVDLQPLVNVCRGLDSLRLQVLNARPSTTLARKLCELPGLCFDTARLEGTDGVPRLVQSLPPGRVVFGSHAPFLIPEAALIRVHEAGLLTEDQLRMVYESGLSFLIGSPQ